jgi:hypothetical protein
MAVNVIVVAVTLLVGGFVALWLVYPRCRTWFEAPKWQPLSWDRPPRSPGSTAHCGQGEDLDRRSSFDDLSRDR